MKQRVFAVVLIVSIIGIISGCDSSQDSKSSKSESTEKSVAESATETSADTAMETGDSVKGPVALLVPEEVVGAGDNNEGVSHYQQSHWDVAKEHFQKAVAANANLAEAHYNLALALDKLGNHGDATNHFKMALELAPDNPSIKDSGILKAHVSG